MHCLVTRIGIEGARDRSRVYQGGERRFVAAAREVILSGGAINSPHVLMLSGIGDAAELTAHEIAVKAALPGGGKNLQDHVAALLIYGRRDESPLLRHRIRQGLLSVKADWRRLSSGIRIFRELARLPRLSPFVAREIGPGARVSTDGELEGYVRKTAVTARHPCGTCRIGAADDAIAVVVPNCGPMALPACVWWTRQCSPISLEATSTHR